MTWKPKFGKVINTGCCGAVVPVVVTGEATLLFGEEFDEVVAGAVTTMAAACPSLANNWSRDRIKLPCGTPQEEATRREVSVVASNNDPISPPKLEAVAKSSKGSKRGVIRWNGFMVSPQVYGISRS
jgi:hypothetical protein